MSTRITAAAALTCLLSTAAFAQNTTAVGTGISGAEANSASGAIAVNRGNGNSNSSLTVNNPANTTSTSTLNQNVSGTTTSNINQRVSGSTTVKSAPPIAAPSLAAAGLETCLGSASGGVSWLGTGIVGGSTYVDPGCEARLDSRTLASWGLKGAAVARICQQPKIWNSMPDICAQYWPRGMPVPYGVVVVDPGYGANITMSANSGVVRVVNGKTGIEGDCLNYSHTAQKCYHWLGDKPRRKQTVANVQAPHRITVKPKAPPPKEEPKAEPAKVEAPKT